MTQHTPGPWMIEQQDMMESSFRNAVVSTGTDAPWSPLVAEVAVDADARLIAAAPEMLHFVRVVADECHDQDKKATHKMIGRVYGCVGCDARALLARVEGK